MMMKNHRFQTLGGLLAILALAIAACTPSDAPGQTTDDPATMPSATVRPADEAGGDDDGTVGDDSTDDSLSDGLSDDGVSDDLTDDSLSDGLTDDGVSDDSLSDG